jgi:hypothetical protein
MYMQKAMKDSLLPDSLKSIRVLCVYFLLLLFLLEDDRICLFFQICIARLLRSARDPAVVVADHYMGEMWPPRYYQSYYASTILSATRHSLVFVQRVRRNPDTHTHIEKKQKKMGQSRRGFSHYQLIFSFFFFFLCVCVSLYPFSLSLSLSLFLVFF